MKKVEKLNNENLLIKAQNQCCKEFYLVSYLIRVIIEAPNAIWLQNTILGDCMNKKLEYETVYKQTENLFNDTTGIFYEYLRNIHNELCLEFEYNVKYSNLVLYGLCHEYIKDFIVLSNNNICLNLHILQKWLSEQNHVDFYSLDKSEQKIVLYLANGYTPEDIINSYDIEKIKYTNEQLNSVIYKLIPEKCGVKSICQAMAVLYMNNPDLRDNEKCLAMYDKICDGEL